MQANAMRACSLIAERSLFYLKILPARGKKVYFLFPECSYILCNDIASEWKESLLSFPERSYILCRDIASEWKESLLSISRAQLYLMQRYCKKSDFT